MSFERYQRLFDLKLEILDWDKFEQIMAVSVAVTHNAITPKFTI